jgi:DNA primase
VPRHSDTPLSAIKNAVDIVALVGDYLSLRRVGSKFKALCPFHDDHNPSLELNPERQSFKCWSCGAGGDIFDFVKSYEHVDFPEALRMLADRAGIVLERQPTIAASPRGPSKTDLFEVNAWAEGVFAGGLSESPEAPAYVEGRGLSRASVERFRLGYAPEARGWLLGLARRRGYGMELLEQAGLVGRAEATGPVRERFRGRLIFPIHDDRGRTVGFGGRILPRVERTMAEQGRHVAKYLNTAETPLFRKRTLLYGADLARAAARRAGWVAVVEGYTDVIAAHQAGLENVVGTLGTALGEDHLGGLRRLADRVVLVFDGDEAGMSAADRSLELFLGHEIDLRVLTLPAGLDPCDFVLQRGASAFRELAERAPEPPAYLLDRAAARFDLASGEGTRRAAEWVVGILNAAPQAHRLGLEVKQAKVLDELSRRLRVPLEALTRLRRQLQRPTPRRAAASTATASGEAATTMSAPPSGDAAVGSRGAAPAAPIRLDGLDRTDLELMQVALNEPAAIEWLAPRIAPSCLRDAPLRAILEAAYGLLAEGQPASYENLMARLEDPALRGVATDLVASTALSLPEPAPLSEGVRPAPWRERLERMLIVLDQRERQARLADLKRALEAADRHADPDTYRAIELEYRRLLTSGRTRKA